jgi:hypothetical protein
MSGLISHHFWNLLKLKLHTVKYLREWGNAFARSIVVIYQRAHDGAAMLELGCDLL